MECRNWDSFAGWWSSGAWETRTEFINSVTSSYDNHYRDRRYAYRLCKLNDGGVLYQGVQQELPVTLLDNYWNRGCGGNTALNYIGEWYSSTHADRTFHYKCEQLRPEYILDSCEWSTNFVNNRGETFNYECPNDGVIRTVESIHVDEVDRRWKYECCRIKYSTFLPDDIVSMTCDEPLYYENDYQGGLVIQPSVSSPYFLNGISSIHVHEIDRQFKFRRCKPLNIDSKAYTVVTPLTRAEAGTNWKKSCVGLNGGNSVVVGIESYYDSGKRDRTFIIKCGDLGMLYLIYFYVFI